MGFPPAMVTLPLNSSKGASLSQSRAEIAHVDDHYLCSNKQNQRIIASKYNKIHTWPLMDENHAQLTD